ncbi:Similar to ELOVL: Elongation of very long chain fatty acids protein (Drosophila melanogaster) [Cotesia congregata]|uniref:Elongation of very long chain fatty acids protein n=1 Tax=Cotesia congregata TaxID=51543 RepID=A0A8J2HP16_COTCN|nr:Similar to ELOVL: Elongation of very long chain fatty acids protein (Drosophila melanogaster) [Cotesia congregata]
MTISIFAGFTVEKHQKTYNMPGIVDWYRDLMQNKIDKRTEDWFLVTGPGPLLMIFVTYIYFSTSAGPKYMRDKKPYSLKNVLIIYNFIQVVLSFTLVYEGLASGWWNDYSFGCQPVDRSMSPKALRMARAVWLYYICKLIELADTVFFVLRKKQRQISFLHVWHHSIMIVTAWIGVRFFPGGHATLLGVINSFIHILMYSYYMLSAFGPHMEKYLWWKRHLTTLQLVQFFLIFIHNFQQFRLGCDFPKTLTGLLCFNAGFFTYLFGSFYVKTYLSSRVSEKKFTELQFYCNSTVFFFRAIQLFIKLNFMHTIYVTIINNINPRTKDWFLMSSPWPGFAILAFYLYFVFTLGPRLMANRPPMKLDRIMQIYNVIQIYLSGYLVYKALSLAWLNEYSFVCQPVDYSNSPRAVEIAGAVWFYFMVKLFDLMDTVFFVLRKKQNQVSFLHVYHHAGMVMGAWGLVNSFVHVIMYSHYLATSLKISKPWWKKYITQLQLTQFFLLLIHFSQLIWTKDCGFPLWPAAIFIPQNLFMMVLFGDFYYKAYIKKPTPKINQNGITQNITNGSTKSQ